ncbi:hypothetical protein UB33_10810 [Photobacterium angustum]|uniref:hypothetical protein n=1 Tax=Photobacterium angustum TaxID=661 RepID=UPI0005E48FA1|nr:hypothetical protein [Photobacterium angustum]KJG06137.1 hypothetical protein UB33_10810 [Photobacterium angustum]PSV94358.1 hypothetical protein CTN01_07480 [Photobacterium angustum]
MKIYPLIIVFLCAISLQGCGGGGGGGSSTPIPPSPEPAPSKITHLDLERTSTPVVLGDGDIVYGEQITFALWAQVSDGNSRHVVDNVVWSISDPSLLAPTKKDGRVVFGSFTASTTAKNGGKVTLTATVTNPDGTTVETHVILNVIELEPFNIDIIKMNDTSVDSEDDVPEGFKSSVMARIQWNNGVYTTDKTKVEWVLTGSAFKKADNTKSEHGFTYEPQDSDNTQIGDTSELTASFRGVTSDSLTLRVASPTLKKIVIAASSPNIGRDVDLPTRTDLSTSVPRGLTVSFSARAFFDGDWSDRDVTDQVKWESTNSKDFVENKNAFHAVGNPTKQTDITAHLDRYPEIKSNSYNLKITNAQLTKIKVDLKQGDSEDVPRYISRTLKVTGTFKGDDTDGNAQSFEEDISGSVKCASSYGDVFTNIDEDTPTRFRAVGDPNQFSIITCHLPSSEMKGSIELTVGPEDVTNVEVKADYLLDVPKGQERSFKVLAKYHDDSDKLQTEDVTNNAAITAIPDDYNWSWWEGHKVVAVGAIGSKTSVSASYLGIGSSNNLTLTIKEAEASQIPYNNLLYIAPPGQLKTWSEAKDYCKKAGGRLPTVDELETLSTLHVGPNYGWPYNKDANGYNGKDEGGMYWSSEVDKSQDIPLYTAVNIATGAKGAGYDGGHGNDVKYSVTCVEP